MRIDIVTIFPAYLDPLRQSLPGKAIASGLVDMRVHDLRRWTYDVHHAVDDAPYGGGPGMVMKAPVWGEALDEICSGETLLVVPTPAGALFTQATAQRWSTEKHLVFACGRYEGIDQRVIEDDILIGPSADAQDVLRFPLQTFHMRTNAIQGDRLRTHDAPQEGTMNDER